MSEWFSKGCETCRQAALRGGDRKVLPLVNVSTGPAFLCRCRFCDAWWVETLREMHVVTEAEAHTEFPHPFTTILNLEDDRDRMDRFHAVLQTIAPTSQAIIWQSAKHMLREIDTYLPYARLISLDHDLYPMAGNTEDPGDGLEVAKYLAERKPTCPIIIHSSNGDRARMMAGEFELAGCPVKFVAPLGADWIEAHWANVVRSLLGVKA